METRKCLFSVKFLKSKMLLNTSKGPTMLLHYLTWTWVRKIADKIQVACIGLKYQGKGFEFFVEVWMFKPGLRICSANCETINFSKQ